MAADDFYEYLSASCLLVQKYKEIILQQTLNQQLESISRAQMELEIEIKYTA